MLCPCEGIVTDRPCWVAGVKLSLRKPPLHLAPAPYSLENHLTDCHSLSDPTLVSLMFSLKTCLVGSGQCLQTELVRTWGPREGRREEGAPVLGQMRWGDSGTVPSSPAGHPHTLLQGPPSARACLRLCCLDSARGTPRSPRPFTNRNW